MQKILVIDDDSSILNVIKASLNPTIEIKFCQDLESGKKEIFKPEYNLILLDLYFDQNKSHELLTTVKIDDPAILRKILIMTGSADIDDEIDAHQLGVRDFLRKPFNLKLLKAIIEKHLFELNSTVDQRKKVGPFTLDAAEYKVYMNDGNEDQALDLTHKEFLIMKYFMENNGRVLSREKIIEKVWDYNNDALMRTVDMHISTLRKKLGKYSESINTVRGVGYCFEL